MGTISSHKPVLPHHWPFPSCQLLPLLSASESFYHLPILVNDSNDSNDITFSCYPYHVASKLLPTSISGNPYNHLVRHIIIPIIQMEKQRFGEIDSDLVEGPTGSSQALWFSVQWHSQYIIPSAPNLQHGEAKKPCFQLGKGKGRLSLEIPLGVMSLWLCLCVPTGRFLTLSGQ